MKRITETLFDHYSTADQAKKMAEKEVGALNRKYENADATVIGIVLTGDTMMVQEFATDEDYHTDNSHYAARFTTYYKAYISYNDIWS